jgi:hypothetical protein
MGKKKQNQDPYKRPNKINMIYEDPVLLNQIKTSNAINEPVTASNNEKTSYKDCSYQHKETHRIEIQKRLANSSDIQSLILYLSSISLCIGKIRFLKLKIAFKNE